MGKVRESVYLELRWRFFEYFGESRVQFVFQKFLQFVLEEGELRIICLVQIRIQINSFSVFLMKVVCLLNQDQKICLREFKGWFCCSLGGEGLILGLGLVCNQWIVLKGKINVVDIFCYELLRYSCSCFFINLVGYFLLVSMF